MRIRAAVAALPLLLLAACATSAGTNPSGFADPSASVSAKPAATLGPAVPGATAIAAPVAVGLLPTATGKFGEKPTLTFPSTDPVPSLQRQILVEGTGAVVGKGDYLVANYLGQIWGGKVFDNSYDRKAPTTFQIGVGAVVTGWDVGLVGLKIGSRVLLSLPPADGYKAPGNPGAGIKGTDTIAFVVDIVDTITRTDGGQTDAVPQPAVAGVPKVAGALGKEPTITIPAGTAEPAKNATYVLAKGTGPAITEGNVLAQLVVSDWKLTQTQSTWPSAKDKPEEAASKGVQKLPVEAGAPLEGLIGVPIGSRVLVLIAPSTNAQTGAKSDAAVAVIDVVGQA